MGLNWNFVRITPEQHARLLREPSHEVKEAIHDERFHEGLGDAHSPSDEGDEVDSFDTIYHLSLRTSYDELDTLMTLEGDDGPVLTWPLGETGVHLPSLGDLFYLLDPDEVRTLARTMELLLETYLDRRYAAEIERLAGQDTAESDIADLEELYPELRMCFADLTHFVRTAATKGEAIMWDLS